ncbi:MAG TPA: PAS domain S-box protein [Sediminispirochaeta sp.]|nr:PAS domain S-box protein [Sediminispirochaeta sp.]
MNGVEAARMIQERHRLPVVFYSSHTDAETIGKTAAVEYYGCVQKAPGNDEFLCTTVRMALELHGARKRLEQQERMARKENQLLRRFFEQSEALVAYLDRDFNFIKVNEKYALNSRCRPEELVGKNHFELYPNRENEAIFSEVVRSGRPYSVKARPFRHPDQPARGTTYWDWTASPVIDEEGGVEGLIFTLNDVTDSVRSTAEQSKGDVPGREESNRFRTLVSAMHEGLVIHQPDGSIEMANRRAQEIFLMDEATLKEIYPLRGDARTYNEDGSPLPSEEHPVMHSIKTGEAVYKRIVGLDREAGDFVWISINTVPFFDPTSGQLAGVISSFRDVTAERVYQRQIESITDSIDSIVFVTDIDDYSILFINKKARQIVGDVLGRPCHQVFCDRRGTPREACARRSLFDGTELPGEGRKWEFHRQRSDKWYRVFCKAISWPGEPWARLVIATDITETKRYERELEMLLVEMNHRVKNNLANVIALTRIELSDSSKDSATVSRDIVQHIQAIEMLHDTLYQSRSFSSVEVGPYFKSLLDFLVNDTYSGSLPDYDAHLEYEELRVNTKYGTKLGLILAELASNTIKHSGCTEHGDMWVSLSIREQRVVFKYSDSGKGFDSQVKSFEDIKGGTGTMLIEILVKDMDGEIILNNREGRFEFVLSFPRDILS